MTDKPEPKPDRNRDLELNQQIHPVPDETEIEYLLGSIKPEPGARFYNQLKATPWTRKRRGTLLRGLLPQSLPAVLVLFIVVFLILAFPSLEAVANRIAQYFTPAASDQVLVQIPLFDLVDSDTRIFQTIPEAARLVGFEIKSPSQVPEGYTFMGAEYKPEREAIILNYSSQGGYLLRISQRRKGLEYQSISNNARVETVNIEGVMGEYVVGGWKATSTQYGEPTSILTITLQAKWDPDANIHFLRWQENDILYEIIFSGDNPESSEYLDKADLISIAEDLQ